MSEDESEKHEVLLFNPLPWDREVSGIVPTHAVSVRGVGEDPTASRHFQDRERNYRDVATLAGDDPGDIYNDQPILPPTTVPGYGYASISSADLETADAWPFDERSTVETDRYRLEFDRERGGISSWYDRELDCEWVDADADWPAAGFVHERVADDGHDHPRSLLFRYPEGHDWQAAITGADDVERGFQPDWNADRTGPERVVRHRVYETPLGYDVRQRLAHPSLESDVALRILVPETGETVVVEASWVLSQTTHPEATYLAFPFDLADPNAYVDVGDVAIETGEDQLPGSAYDYYTAQRWVEVATEDRGVTVGTPVNPMVQFGDFGFAANADDGAVDAATVLGWVSNTYWETNFRASQPGLVRARYHLTPHSGPFDETAAHRRGLEAAHADPLVQTTEEPTVDEPPLEPGASLLALPDPPIMVRRLRPAAEDDGVLHPEGGRDENGVRCTLYNASDAPREAVVGPGAVSFDRAARVALDGEKLEVLPLEDGTVTVVLDGRETAVLHLE
ncbi:hypothetical protein [Halomontanus rarus]|uniref:hypothetical protein n=1 Tax=Halomontanus rarus TaxID=3034020 RepID=UPI0023E77CF2|nr:hypothetical protein [Halovivax sp. TS33]